MANDLVERLRKLAERERPYGSLPDTLDEAAARIEQLEKFARRVADLFDGKALGTEARAALGEKP